MDICVEVVNDGERRLFVIYEAGRFKQPLLVLDDNDVEGVVAKYRNVSREDVKKL